ncbi:unnamed protein product [Peniophora sp. CBMAI 1063]|nr:unnamed protein product [Peniophora sp. CBMAI 1063]
MSNYGGVDDSANNIFGSGSKYLFVALAVIPCVALGWMLERRRRRRLDAVVARFMLEEYPELRSAENRVPAYYELAVEDTSPWLTSWTWKDAQPLAAAKLDPGDTAKRPDTHHKTQLSFLINMPRPTTPDGSSTKGRIPDPTAPPEYVLATCDVNSKA